jgi:hypothetical protein
MWQIRRRHQQQQQLRQPPVWLPNAAVAAGGASGALLTGHHTVFCTGGADCDRGWCCAMDGRCTQDPHVCGTIPTPPFGGMPDVNCKAVAQNAAWAAQQAPPTQDTACPAPQAQPGFCGPEKHTFCPWTRGRDLCCVASTTGGNTGTCNPCDDVDPMRNLWLWDTQKQEWYLSSAAEGASGALRP